MVSSRAFASRSTSSRSGRPSARHAWLRASETIAWSSRDSVASTVATNELNASAAPGSLRWSLANASAIPIWSWSRYVPLSNARSTRAVTSSARPAAA